MIVDPLPDIGTAAREDMERAAVRMADQLLAIHEDIGHTLGQVRRTLGYSIAGNTLAEHVEQVWIGRILK